METSSVHVLEQGILGHVVKGHFMRPAAFFMQANPIPVAVAVNITDVYPQGSADAGESKYEDRNERMVPEASDRRGVDRVEQLPRVGCGKHGRLALGNNDFGAAYG